MIDDKADEVVQELFESLKNKVDDIQILDWIKNKKSALIHPIKDDDDKCF